MARIARLPKPLRLAALVTVAVVIPGGCALVAGYLLASRKQP